VQILAVGEGVCSKKEQELTFTLTFTRHSMVFFGKPPICSQCTTHDVNDGQRETLSSRQMTRKRCRFPVEYTADIWSLAAWV
jgi:hypothetical protein